MSVCSNNPVRIPQQRKVSNGCISVHFQCSVVYSKCTTQGLDLKASRRWTINETNVIRRISVMVCYTDVVDNTSCTYADLNIPFLGIACCAWIIICNILILLIHDQDAAIFSQFTRRNFGVSQGYTSMIISEFPKFIKTVKLLVMDMVINRLRCSECELHTFVNTWFLWAYSEHESEESACLRPNAAHNLSLALPALHKCPSHNSLGHLIITIRGQKRSFPQ